MNIKEEFKKLTSFKAKATAVGIAVAVVVIILSGLWTVRWVVINFNAVTIHKSTYKVPEYDRVCLIVSNSEDLSVDCWSEK
ncbi:MAG: hypothetical protein COB09_18425 [Thalassobium sp.]|nr:MAG: hypothetical protein COB09_18425 [Thalassobium sp.]